MELIYFGCVSLGFTIFALIFRGFKKSVPSIILGALAVVFMVISDVYWYHALVESGKDERWLGFSQYPIGLIISVALVGTGLFCIVNGIVRLVRKPS